LWSDGKKKRDGKHSLQKSNSIQNSVGNEGNGYPVPNFNKTINVTKKPSNAHKKENPQRRNLGRKP
jgi:hypothetical protein